MTKRILLLNRRAPHGTSYAMEALDVALIAGAFDQEVCIAFVDDGVYQLLTQQQTGAIGMKHFAAGFGALNDYGIENVYVEQESLQARGLTIQDLAIAAIPLTTQEISVLIDAQDLVYSC